MGAARGQAVVEGLGEPFDGDEYAFENSVAIRELARAAYRVTCS